MSYGENQMLMLRVIREHGFVVVGESAAGSAVQSVRWPVGPLAERVLGVAVSRLENG